MHERFKVSSNIKKLCLFLTGSFFLASFAAAWYIDAWDQLLPGWFTIMTSPCPLVTDYFMLGNLASAFFNAGMTFVQSTLPSPGRLWASSEPSLSCR